MRRDVVAPEGRHRRAVSGRRAPGDVPAGRRRIASVSTETSTGGRPACAGPDDDMSAVRAGYLSPLPTNNGTAAPSSRRSIIPVRALRCRCACLAGFEGRATWGRVLGVAGKRHGRTTSSARVTARASVVPPWGDTSPRSGVTMAVASPAGPSPALLDATAAALRLGVPVRFVRRLVAERRVRFIKLGHYVRFDLADLDAFVAAGLVPPLPAPRAARSFSAPRAAECDSCRDLHPPIHHRCATKARLVTSPPSSQLFDEGPAEPGPAVRRVAPRGGSAGTTSHAGPRPFRPLGSPSGTRHLGVPCRRGAWPLPPPARRRRTKRASLEEPA